MPERFQIDWGVGDVVREFGQLRDALGSTAGTAGALSSFGGALGISDIRGAAEALHRASLSGLGQVAASQFGIPYRPLEIGTATDRGEMLLRALEGLREVHRAEGFGPALAKARNLDLEDWIAVVHLTAEQMGRIRQEAQHTQDIYTPERIANATALNNEMSIFNRHVRDLGVAIEGLFTPVFEKALRKINESISRARGEDAPSATSPERLANSMDALRQSVDANTQLARGTQGFFGGGRRARSAIPGAFGIGMGEYLSDNLRSLRWTQGRPSMNT